MGTTVNRMDIRIEAIKAQNSKEKRTATAQYTVWYGRHYYQSLEQFCISQGLNSRLVSRRLNAYLRENGSLDGITFSHLTAKNNRKITVDGRTFKGIQEYLNMQGLPGKDNRKRFDKYQVRLLRRGDYQGSKDPQLIRAAVELIKQEINQDVLPRCVILGQASPQAS